MISVITPTHDAQWLDEALSSLMNQAYQDWEWVLQPNGGLSAADLGRYTDSRIKILAPQEGTIGALKRTCCEAAQGDVIVELDHDDLLMPNALQMIVDVFADKAVDFAYSNFAEFQADTWEPHTYNSDYGWETEPTVYDGHQLAAMRAFPPSPQSFYDVAYAPNHVRAWRASTYWDIGGHDESLSVCDDHDLCCRFYLNGTVNHIDECLYLYRLHDGNTYKPRRQQIRAETKRVGNKYLHLMIQRWAKNDGLRTIDLGAAHGKPAGYEGLDIIDADGVDIVHDATQGLPFDDNSIGVIRAYDFLEHIEDSVFLMNEIYRVLVDGGWLLSGTPSTDGRGAFQDPTHRSYWNQNSFWYYTNGSNASYVPRIGCRFQAVRLETFFPTDFHRDHDIPYVYADLCATKSWRRRPGLQLI